MACIFLFASIVMTTLGCSNVKPKNEGTQSSSSIKNPSKALSSSDESDTDFTLDYSGNSSLHRNLPLSGTTWEWEGGFDSENFVKLDNPSQYKIEFKFNGWFDFQADCKRGSGIYEVKGEHIALAVIKASRKTCANGSKADEFQSSLETVRGFRVDETKLFFDVKRSEKTLIFHLKP